MAVSVSPLFIPGDTGKSDFPTRYKLTPAEMEAFNSAVDHRWQSWPWTNFTIVFPLQSGNSYLINVSDEVQSLQWHHFRCICAVIDCHVCRSLSGSDTRVGLTSSVAPGELWTCTSPRDTSSSKITSALLPVLQNTRKKMKTYNANPGYEMDHQLLTHLTSIWIHYSGSIRNCYRSEWICLPKKHIQLRMRLQVRHVREMLQLINEVGDKLVGYAWVMNIRNVKGFTFILWVIWTVRAQEFVSGIRIDGRYLEAGYRGDGYYHWCRFNKNYPVNINQSFTIQITNRWMLYAMPSATCQTRTERMWHHPEMQRASWKSNRGRPRLDSTLPGICSLV